jgi:hypothetical protein
MIEVTMRRGLLEREIERVLRFKRPKKMSLLAMI